MQTKQVLWTVVLLLSTVLTACSAGDVAPTPTEEVAQPVDTQAAPTALGEPVIIADGPPCLSPSLGVTLVMPSPEWDCSAANDNWLKLTSSLFEVNISNLGRGPFCNSSMDNSCQTTSFYATDNIDLQLYVAGGQAREIFGLAQFPDSDISVWVAITWQDMATHSLTEAERTEIERLVSSLSLLNP